MQLYRILSVCLGSPPETVTWEYYDKDKQYHKVGPMTPLEFYQQYVQPHFNVSDKVTAELIACLWGDVTLRVVLPSIN